MKELLFKFLGDIKKNYKTLILAFVLSFAFWIIVSINVFPMIEVNIKGITIEAQLTDKMLQNNLQITSAIDEAINITIAGKRYEISDLKSSDFFASIDLSEVRSTGTYTVPINVTPKNTGRELTISSISPSFITISIDKIISKEFTVRAAAPNITIPDGYYLDEDELTATPEKITLTGSATILNQIGYVEASSTSGGDITESRQTASDIIVYGSFGIKMDKTNIQFDTDNIMVNIPVYRQKELPLRFSIVNYPSNFDLNSLKFDIQPKSIIVASPDDSINNLSELTIEAIDIADIQLNKTIYVPIVLPEGYKNLSGNNNAQIEWQLEDYGKLDFTISTKNIDISNKPGNFDVSVITNTIKPTVIGPSDIISTLTPSDFIVRLDLLGVSLRDGTQDVSVSVQIKGENQTCWISGKNRITIKAEAVS